MIIRNASYQDLQAILDIFNYEIIHTAFVYIHQPWTMEIITEWFSEKQASGFPFIVAESDGVVVGYAYYGTFRARAAYDATVEFSVYIHRDHRGKGIGYRLVSQLIETAKTNGLRCFIGGADSGNTESIKFQERMGFTKVAHITSAARKFDQWLDLVLYQLVLNEEAD